MEIETTLAARSVDAPLTGPLVSVVIVTHDGLRYLERLLPALERSVYSDIEVIVVDNASTDGTAAYLARPWRMGVRVIANDSNESFSHANNQAAAVAAGTMLLFLNNDVEPIVDTWLGSMVQALEEDPCRVAAGAVLVYSGDGRRTDFTVQHRGIDLVIRDGAPFAVNVTAGDPLDRSLDATVDVEAATAAALLVRADAFRAVGGFDPTYVYGAEDVDLCLRLSELGRIVVVGQARMFHDESATLRDQDRTERRYSRDENWQHFAAVWGPSIVRRLHRAHLAGRDLAGKSRRPTAAITVTRDDPSAGWGDYYTAHELGGALGALGWDVVYIERFRDRWYRLEAADVVIALLDSYDARRAPCDAITVAWIRNWVDRWVSRPWFDRFDTVLCGSGDAAAAVARRTCHEPHVVPLATNPQRFSPGGGVAEFAADYAFTGNNWGSGRDLLTQLDVRDGERFVLCGKGWEGCTGEGVTQCGHVDYDRLVDVYRSARIVLDDTAAPTRQHHFLNSRVFDALAAGALVLTDNRRASEELFDGLLPCFESAADLRRQLDRYLADDELRTATAAELRRRVLDRYTYPAVARRLIDCVDADLQRPSVALRIGVPSEEVLEHWGDTHYARSLAASLRDRGFSTRTQLRSQWNEPGSHNVDAAIHLRGLGRCTPNPRHVNILWIISHPDEVTVDECDDYDVVFVASELLADRLRGATTAEVVYLPQATDARRFRPTAPDPALAHDVLFVGNSRNTQRHGVAWAAAVELPLTVYGSGWEGRIPPALVRDTYYPNEDLGRLYASAKVVLNDHWPDMARMGFVSNRVFDVLGAGGVVVSDPVPGMEELFGDLVPTYSSAAELDDLVTSLLADEPRRREIGRRGAALVADHHTMDQRADVLATWLRDGIARRAAGVRTPPSPT